MSAVRASHRAFELAPFALAIGAYGWVAPAGGIAAGLFLLLSFAVGPRVTLDLLAQIALSLVGLISGVLMVTYVLPKPPGPLSWSALTLGALLAGALRFVLKGPAGGPKVTQAFALAAFSATGGYRTPEFPYVLVLFVVVLSLTVWRLEPGRPGIRELGVREWVGLGAGSFVAAAVGLGAAAALPPLHDRVLAVAERFYTFQSAGFDPQISLGQMRDQVKRTRRVLRVFGENPGHLRGIVYSRYRAGRWSSAPGALVPVPLKSARETATTEVVELLRHEQLFVPLEASALGGLTEKAHANAMGVLLAEPTDDRVWFRVERKVGAGRPPVADPGPTDIDVPETIRPELEGVAARMAGTASSALELAGAIERGLSDGFEYSLDFQRTDGVDPVIDFLTKHREGHCEYFATAMVLLLRTRGVPARMVGGFLVTEQSPLGGYFLVRDSNAHAWVEAFIEGSWRTLDPTPAGALRDQMPSEMDLATSLLDGLVVGLAGIPRWFKARTVGELGATALGLLALWAVYRVLRRGAREKVKQFEEDAPLPCLDRLMARIERSGLRRLPSESLEAFALRVGESPLGQEPVDLLMSYAALRYGRVGERGELEAKIEAWVTKSAEERVADRERGT
ncbi:MAG: transglutaminase domain-containing protein [Deltaproteobacteria bacterium]|nr:transglutaminase domain-containing protein [Deltaproteobacteria bacterium]